MCCEQKISLHCSCLKHALMSHGLVTRARWYMMKSHTERTSSAASVQLLRTTDGHVTSAVKLPVTNAAGNLQVSYASYAYRTRMLPVCSGNLSLTTFFHHIFRTKILWSSIMSEATNIFKIRRPIYTYTVTSFSCVFPQFSQYPFLII